LLVSGDGQRVVAHAGSRLLCDLADVFGLTDGLSAAMAPTKRRRRGHDRGRVLVDLAVMLADGALKGSTVSIARSFGVSWSMVWAATVKSCRVVVACAGTVKAANTQLPLRGGRRYARHMREPSVPS
jgi:hypothetical protein